MISKFGKSVLLASVAAALVLPITPALAAEGDDEIIVQARKRDESIMSVPVVATVIGEAKLDQYAIGSVEDIADKVTGLNYQSGNNASGTLVSLRGVGTNSNNPAVDQSVALVVDGQQFTQGLAFRAATFDMSRVEVLKGPQALFFGKAAPGGVISIKTADPGDRLELLARAGYEFEAQKQVYEAVVSGPVSSTLGLRLAAQYSDANGYFHNVSNPVSGPLAFGAIPPVNKRVHNNETFILRGTALWKPVDSFSARLKFNYVRDEIQGWGSMGQMVSCPEGTAPRLPIPYAAIAGDDCKLDRNYYGPDVKPASFGDGTLSNNGVEFNLSEQYFGSLELNYDISPTLSLTSVSTYYDVSQKSLGNVTISSNVGPVFMLDGTWDRKDFTQELRLTS
ncbi:MAG: TonB-dependent receptor plug domain-containing protein, partial [Novosphingobium sp.]